MVGLMQLESRGRAQQRAIEAMVRDLQQVTDEFCERLGARNLDHAECLLRIAVLESELGIG